MLSAVAILAHPRSPEAGDLAMKAASILRSAGVRVEKLSRNRDLVLPSDVDMLISIGGDGTVIRAQRLAVPQGVPVLGVAAGRLGFLAEVRAGEMQSALETILAGANRIEERALLDVKQLRSGRLESVNVALNDAVLARGRRPRSLWITVSVNGAEIDNYVADGVIAATATGSTAYALAAGGPVLDPRLRDILLTPIAAHLAFVQSVVLPGDVCIELSLARKQDALLSVDGQVDIPVLVEDKIHITLSERTARFVRVTEPSHFYATLVPRLQHDLAHSRSPRVKVEPTEEQVLE